MASPATTGGDLVRRLMELVGLDPERTVSFKVWVDGPNDFVHLEHTGYAPEYTLSAKQLIERGWTKG